MSGVVPGGTLVVVNPASAGGRTLARWRAGARLLQRHAVDHDVHVTTAPGSATEAVRAALRRGGAAHRLGRR